MLSSDNNYERPVLITHGGEIKTHIPEHVTHFEIDELIGIVGGKLEIIKLPDSDLLMIFNEEAKSKNLPGNKSATEIVEHLTGETFLVNGNVMICPSDYMGTYYLP